MSEDSTRRRGAILIVGEGDGAGRALMATLDEAGYCPLCAADLRTAVAFLEAAMFDVVIGAGTMSAPDRLALAEHVRLRRPETQVLVADDGWRSAAGRIDAGRLVRTVEEALDQARRRQAARDLHAGSDSRLARPPGAALSAP